MDTPSPVVLVRCGGYGAERVEQAIEQGISLLGGAERYAKPGETIVLKPNLLVGRSPERAVNTHPDVFRAVAHILSRTGATLVYGDSPGIGRPADAAARSGIGAVARELGIRLADFSHGETVSFPEGSLIKQFVLARGVTEAQGLISLPKLKTHGLTRLTGAVKNQFGCIPGALKAEFHARLPNADLFSRMLVDLNRCLRPRLFVMDAVVAMEGNGPQGGTPRPMHALLLSEDPVAMDTVACRMVSLDPSLVPTIFHGDSQGLGTSRPAIVGDEVESFVAQDFAVNRSLMSTTGRPGRPSRWARRFVVPKPRIQQKMCTRCGTCVAICPIEPKAISFPEGNRERVPEHDYELCIRCYCCQEMCPEHAIDVAVPLLGRFIHGNGPD